MKLLHYSIIILIISTIYCLVAGFIFAKILFDHMGLFGNAGPALTIVEKCSLIAIVLLFFALIIGAVIIGKRMLNVWSKKACIMTVFSVFAGIPVSLLLMFVYSVLN